MPLGACEGTEWGNTIEDALAPGVPEVEAANGIDRGAVDAPDRGGDVGETPIASNVQQSDSSESLSQISDPIARSNNPSASPPDLPESANSTDLDVILQTATDFADLDQAPILLQAPLKAVVDLGVLSVTGSGKALSPELPLFEPNRQVTRREFVRWLVAANNVFYQNRPGRQIRLATTTDAPVFEDVSVSNPDFPAIQGLAAAGFIANPLTGAVATLQFRPDEPLIRETLVLWKVAIEAEQLLPTVSIDKVQQTWGFQDATQISAAAQGAVFVDFQNGELSNIRRVFGYTTLLQPQKSVTRAEAAVALWYFGSSGQGISATDLLNQ